MQILLCVYFLSFLFNVVRESWYGDCHYDETHTIISRSHFVCSEVDM